MARTVPEQGVAGLMVSIARGATSVRHYYNISYPRDGKLSYTGE